jgi:parallel beta-helix repeat protein
VCRAGAAPTIEGNTVEWNGRYGIRADGSLPIIRNSNLVQYNRLEGIFVKDVISAEGKPDFIPGTDLGYFIWYDATGWHVKCSSDAEVHVFNGTIKANSDVTTFIRTVPGGGESTLYLEPYAKVEFDIYIDGVRSPELTFIGSGEMNPISIPFKLAEGVTITGNNIKDNFASGVYASNTNIPITDNTISSNGLGLKFRDTVENLTERNRWTTTGLWHAVDNKSGMASSWNLSHEGDWSWWYGINKTTIGDYDTGTINSGNLTSPTIDLRDANTATLTFWSWYETDTYGDATDHRWVTIQNTTLNVSYQLYGEIMGDWTRYVLNITAFKGKNITLTFKFNTVDGNDNQHQGWNIDDVEIVAAYPAIEGHGICMAGCTPSYIHNNTIEMNNWHGIYCSDNFLTIIDNNTVSGNRMNGILLSTSSKIKVTGNMVFKNYNGICLWYCPNSNTSVNNNTVSSNNNGIYLYSSSKNIIINNTASLNRIGFLLVASSGNTITNNKASSNKDTGIHLSSYTSSNNTLTNNTVISNNFIGIMLSSLAYSNIIANNTISSNNWVGIYLIYCSNILIINSTISNSVYDFLFYDNGHATALNTAFDKSKVKFRDTMSTLTVQWFLHVGVVDETFTPVEGASVLVEDLYGDDIISSVTYADSWIRWIRATEYVQNKTNTTCYTAHNITASNATLTGWAMPEPFVDKSMEVYVLLGPGAGYNINLHQGWNLISIPYMPYNMSSENIPDIMKSIEGKWSVVEWYNPQTPADPWKKYRVDGTANDLLHLNHTMGFWLYVLEPCTFLVMGYPQPVTQIHLYTGWNMVGYPTNNHSVNISTALSGIAEFRDKSVEGFFADLQVLIAPYPEDYLMQPGQGYWIHVNASCVWTVGW